ncbi:hypothetical protein Hoch_1878 [Haliangium ochraceum DSM 14365]|uniref:Uncharacterized protein n=1 Tax=Haliangium ochraceum (strain DSM 14365 / JCM 11303 / SMP-2) TaxID=502025 RepID=D0LYV5_HALO1|nr:hypothetical protein [Haliangium ochraceum]ACY14425.1 hypothetical protein Hoch_1878 [Haliangium ochraceum DSM 14365]
MSVTARELCDAAQRGQRRDHLLLLGRRPLKRVVDRLLEPLDALVGMFELVEHLGVQDLIGHLFEILLSQPIPVLSCLCVHLARRIE